MAALLLDAALTATRARAQSLLQGEPLQRAFFHWLESRSVDTGAIETLAAELGEEIRGAGRSVQAVSALGFLCATGASEVTRIAAFTTGVRWLLGRQVSSSGAGTALVQAVPQLGLLVGVLVADDAALLNAYRQWVLALLARAGSGVPDTWQSEIVWLVRRRLTGTSAMVESPHIGGSAVLAMAARCVVSLDPAQSTEQAAEALLARLTSQRYVDAEAAALDLAAYAYLSLAASHTNLKVPTLDDLGLMLDRIPSALRKWTWEGVKLTSKSVARKWHVDHEYHFQNMLTCLLAPMFPDMKDEEWLSSIGPKKPRADMVIPSLEVVVEVKFWRGGVPATEMVSQIAEDVGLYLKQGSPYRWLVPVLWDQASRTEEHAYLASGLSQMRGVRHPTIVAPAGVYARHAERVGAYSSGGDVSEVKPGAETLVVRRLGTREAWQQHPLMLMLLDLMSARRASRAGAIGRPRAMPGRKLPGGHSARRPVQGPRGIRRCRSAGWRLAVPRRRHGKAHPRKGRRYCPVESGSKSRTGVAMI